LQRLEYALRLDASRFVVLMNTTASQTMPAFRVVGCNYNFVTWASTETAGGSIQSCMVLVVPQSRHWTLS